MARLFSNAYQSAKLRSDNKVAFKKKLFVAFEGSKNEPKYFKRLRIHLKGIEKSAVELYPVNRKRRDGRSDPENVKNGLIEFYKEEIVSQFDKKRDQLWIVIDIDKHFERANEDTKVVYDEFLSNLSTTDGVEIRAAVSSPCFELWQILHFKNPSEIDIDEIRRLSTDEKSSHTKSLLSTTLSLEPQKDYMVRIDDAVTNAKSTILMESNDKLIDDIGTTMYVLIESLYN
jgi:hypothetical protein